MEVVADAVDVIGRIGDAASAIVVAGGLGSPTVLAPQSPAERAAAFVRLFQWIARGVRWLIDLFRSSSSKPKTP